MSWLVALLVVPLQMSLIPLLRLHKTLGDSLGMESQSYLGVWLLHSAFGLPLSVPALASFAIFQFLWVWNDYLIALIFLGTQRGPVVLTVKLNNLLGCTGYNWEILTASAFISIAVLLAVFFSLQRFFVRGLVAWSVRGD